jgi:hypothetical protein
MLPKDLADFDPDVQRLILASRHIDTRGSGRHTFQFDVFAKGSETGDWLAALDDFRNWLIREAA